MAVGSFYIVATPIGNLEDITFRAISTLKKVDLILSEDTRETDKVLKHYDISKKQLSYRDQNHEKMLPIILDELNTGTNIALVSDSGTPLISDPGYKLIRELKSQNISITSIPGPSALINSLVTSGLPTDKFSFLGFLPKSSGQIEKILKTYGNLDSTLIIYESPYRLLKLLKSVEKVLGKRKVCVAREMTKKHEEVTTGQINEIIDHFEKNTPKGEIVVLIEKENNG